MWEDRRARVLRAMQEKGLGQMLVTDPKSVWYLTGIEVEPYERLFALYLRADGHHKIFANRLFVLPETSFETFWFGDTDDAVGILAAQIDAAGPIGIDKTWPARFLLPLLERCPALRPVLASDCVDDCRACKDAEELVKMREASRINDVVIELAAAQVRVGVTEKALSDYIAVEYAARGCSGPSFTTIVSFGAHAADPHHVPDDTPLQAGECVLFDMGCRKDRYCSDMTRTYFCRSADSRQKAVHDLVRRANEAAEAMIRPGVRLCDVDAAARALITEAGFGPNFNHRLGHFIGQDDHEQGDVSASSKITAREGMIFSIEPGVYLPGEFGVRIEDLVLVTADGHEVLNHVKKEWTLLG